MAITNTGIVERAIVGVNESDLFLDSEATSVVNNTGVVERAITGSNESELWLDAESTSVVNNTGIVERPISGVNESDPMFPNNTISNIVNLANNLVLALINAFKSRVSSDGGTLDNEVGLNIDDLDDTTTLTMLPNAYKAGKLYCVLPEDASGDFEVVRNSNATRVNSLGLIDSVSSNEPRIDHTDGHPVLLLEPQSTNLVPYSEDFSDASWAKATSGSGVAPIVTSNYAISPDGTQNAARIQFNATTSGSNADRSRVRTTLTFSDATDYTTSFYAKSTDGTDQKISVLFDNSQISVKTITSEWQRFEATSQQIGTSSICGLDLRGGNASTSDILVYGIQIEELPYATSYIPTSGTIATRLADSVSGAGDASTFNDSEGVLYFEGSGLFNSGNSRFISISDGSTSNRVALLYYNVDNRVRAILSSGGTKFVDKNIAIPSITDNIKVALKYKTNDFAMWINGVEVSTDTTLNAPIGLNNLSFNLGGNNPFLGKVKDLRTYDTALTDAELLTLTTL